MRYKMVLGFFKFIFHLAFSKNKEVLREIILELSKINNATKNKVFVMSVGLSNTGKTTMTPILLKEQYPANIFFKIVSKEIHDLINKRLIFLQDDNTVNGFAYWERQFITRYIRMEILKKVMASGVDIYNDSCNNNRKNRSRYLLLAKKNGYTAVIAWMNKDASDLLALMRHTAKKIGTQKAFKTNKDLFRLQKNIYDIPLSNEADRIFAYGKMGNTEKWKILDEGSRS